jgi:hypothetical protein
VVRLTGPEKEFTLPTVIVEVPEVAGLMEMELELGERVRSLLQVWKQ